MLQQLGQLRERVARNGGDRAQRNHVPAQHLSNPFGVDDRDFFTVGAVGSGVGATGATPGQAHQLAGDGEPLGDSHQQVIGQHLAAGEDLRHLGLGLPGQCCDVPLGEPGVFEQLVRKYSEFPSAGAVPLVLL